VRAARLHSEQVILSGYRGRQMPAWF